MKKREGAVWICDIPAGSKVAKYGDWLVVAAPDAPPFMVHAGTGERREIDVSTEVSSPPCNIT